MAKRLPLIGMTILMLIIADLIVAAGLAVMGRIGGPFDSIVSYFDYGRSVPGKLAQWEATPGVRGNLYDVAWNDDVITRSIEEFSETPDRGPVLRAYGMSFLNDITRAAEAQRAGFVADRHAGPAASPNFAYSIFQDDAANRRPGDVAVIGVLSSSVAALATFSNSSWLFEQPAPFTYPVYDLTENGLIRIDPVVDTAAQHRTLRTDRELAREWRQQRAEFDELYSPITHAWTWADISPFGRLARRYAATYHLTKTEQKMLGTGGKRRSAYAYDDVLVQMLTDFSDTARQEGLIPVVVLIQTQGDYPDLKAALGERLEAAGVPYLATSDLHSPKDATGFKADGHFKDEPNALFGSALLSLIDETRRQNP